MTVTTTSNSARTYDSIATVSTGSGVTTLSLTSIPQTYTDLRLVINARYTSAPNGMTMQLNSTGGSGYNQQNLYLQNYMAVNYGGLSYLGNNQYWQRPAFDNQNDGVHIIDFINYTSTSLAKTAWWQQGSGNGVGSGQYTWQSTAAITTISVTSSTMQPLTNPFSMSLYGIKAA